MYLDHFGLHSAPYNITSDTDFFFAGAARGATLAALLYAIEQGEGIVKVTGEVGSGKTMLCSMLLEALPENVETIFLSVPSLKRDEILQALCAELGCATAGESPYQLLSVLQDKLIDLYAQDCRVVALVDEAHAMPQETLEEIRLLSNLENGNHKLLQIILFGQPELDDLLRLPSMRALKERITHHFQLDSLTRDDIRTYLNHRLDSAGYRGPELFSPACVKLIEHASEGLARRVNIIADKSLLAAYSDNTHTLTPAHLRAAIRDSHFPLPNPWGRRAAVGAATLAIVGAAAFGLKNTAWFESAPSVVAAEKASTGAIPALADQKNINKNNELDKYPSPSLSPQPTSETSTSTLKNAETTVNSGEKITSATNGDLKVDVALPKVGFELDGDLKPSPLPSAETAKAEPDAKAAAANKTDIAADTKSAAKPESPTEPKIAPDKVAKLSVTTVASDNHQKGKTDASAQNAKPGGNVADVNTPKNLQSRIAASKTWLDAQPESQCVIQLLIADISNTGNIEQFLGLADRQTSAGKIFVFPSQINGQDKFTVVAGDFPNGMNCETALSKLSPPLKQAKPYTRTVGLLRNEAKFPG